MLDYVTIGTNAFQDAVVFYDAVLGALGFKQLWKADGFAGYGPPDGQPRIFVMRPFDGKPASVGNGMMIALAAPSRAAVRAFHSAALASGGGSEGEAGVREQYAPDFYVAYIRDRDGNKLAAVCHSTGE